MMEQSLRAIQVQKMMPQTLHSMQLLSLPLLLLHGYLTNLVLDNPFLEPRFDGVEQPLPPFAATEEWAQDGDAAPRRTPPSETTQHPLPYLDDRFSCAEDSLYEHLRFQADLSGFDPVEDLVARYLLAGIDGAGYLDESVASVAAVLGCETALVERVLAVIQTFSPAGVGARTLSECLCLQVDAQRTDAALLTRLIREDLPALAERRFSYLSRKYKIGRAHIQALLDDIKTLDPKPGSRFSGARFTPFLLPDATVKPVGRRPDIRVRGKPSTLLDFNPDYMKNVEDAQAIAFLKQKKLEAVGLMGSLDMRYHALERLVGYLAGEQWAFFTDGPSALRPLTQKQAAQDLGLHPSTISRCVRDKYIGTPWGTFPMSYFFSGSLGDGDCAAALARDAVGALIAREDKYAPLSDLAIAEQLSAQGIPISRRTVAKYRAGLGLGGQAARIRYDRPEPRA